MVRTFAVPAEVRKALGERVWWPDTVPKRRRLDGRPRYNPVYVFLLLAVGAVTANMSFFLALVYRDNWSILGFLFAVAFPVAIFSMMTPTVRMPMLAVHQKGVLVPQTVTVVPGMHRLGGPTVLPLSDIRGAKRVAEGETLAVLIETASGQTGLVDNEQRDQGLTAGEWQATIDGLCAALVQIGVSVKRGYLRDVGPNRPSEEE